MTMPAENLIECWTCGGDGALSILGIHRKKPEFPCHRCKGVGKVPEVMREWEKAGAALKAGRLEREVYSVRDEAISRGILPSELSNAELGIIDPTKYLQGKPSGPHTPTE